MVNVILKVYERVKKSAIIEKRKTERLNKYLFFAISVKCLDKSWLKDCLIELKTLG